MVGHGMDTSTLVLLLPLKIPKWTGSMTNQARTRQTADWDEGTLRTRHTLDATRKSRANGREISVAK